MNSWQLRCRITLVNARPPMTMLSKSMKTAMLTRSCCAKRYSCLRVDALVGDGMSPAGWTAAAGEASYRCAAVGDRAFTEAALLYFTLAVRIGYFCRSRIGK